MVRQYIGARYVPKFYQNSLNPLSNEWQANVTYEALTVVTYLNDSYTSKKPVPVTVGNPRDNSEYWALTGAYNAQIEEYREEVEALKEHTYLVIADSYGTTTYGYNFLSYLQNYIENAYCYGNNGMGIYNPGANEQNIRNFIQEKLNENPTVKFTDVVICVGINDGGGVSDANLDSAFANLETFINNNTRIKDCKIHIGFTSNRKNKTNTQINNYINAVKNYIKNCESRKNFCYLTGVENIMHNTENFAADNLHLSEIGAKRLAEGVANAIKKGSCDVLYHNTQRITLVNEQQFWCDQIVKNDVVNVYFGKFYATFDEPLSFEVNNYTKIGEWDSNIVDFNELLQITGTCVYSDGSNNIVSPITLQFKNNGEVYANLLKVVSVHAITVNYLSFCLPTISC